MTRQLKELYPCRLCSTPTAVECRRDIEHATCRTCSARLSALRSASWRMENATKLHREHNGVHEEVLEVAPWMFEAASEALAASSNLLKAAALNTNEAERASWVRIAISWSKWGTSLSKSTRAELREVAPPPAVLVQGVLNLAELTPPKRGHLSVVSGSR